MKKFKFFTLLIILPSLTISAIKKQPTDIQKDYPIQPVAFNYVQLTDSFWYPRLKLNQKVTIPIALEQCYKTGRVDNFKKAGHLMEGYFDTQFPFDDTDIYKIIEGASYSIQVNPNKELETQIDTLIYYISKAQEPDGYLYTARTAAQPGRMHPWVGKNRWEKAPDLSHELYNCGHLYEAAVAHYLATGKRSLLDIAIKNADLLVKDFGPGKLTYEPGHQIVEMGLVKMYRVTGKKAYLDLAKYFLDLRGKNPNGQYSQNHKPVIEQDEAVGHAVRAGYMYSGMADVAALTGNEAYLHAIDKIWENVVGKKLYITGGIGSTSHGEAFGANYELPNMSAYCETCAAIANVYWNYRLFLLHGESKYYDILERTLYNGVISGISLSGDHFFYPNPLESVGQHARSEWFGCACCPSNLCRFIPSIPGYVYAQNNDKIYVNLFVESKTNIQTGKNTVSIQQKTDYPWKGDVSITVSPKKKQQFTLMIRVPNWAVGKPVPSDLYQIEPINLQPVKLKINGKEMSFKTDTSGYIELSRKWKKEDKIDISFPMQVERILANDKVKDDQGKVSLERGPIVYCLEWPDNQDKVLNSVLGDGVPVTATFKPLKLNGIVELEADGQSTEMDLTGNIRKNPKHLTAIPYYAWANRGSGEMAVWIPRTIQKARPATPSTICTNAKITSSIANKTLKCVNDGYEPENSNDTKCPFFSLWPQKNSEEWIAYEFEKEETVSKAKVYWYDDGPWGGCRIPASWKVQYQGEDGSWQDVKTLSAYETKKDAYNTIEFEPVNTRAIRLVYQLQEKNSVGIYEFAAY
ncbi:MAG: glycoside hydrolase family 127 protein [Paludibacter sp.]|nr:glycoside hydrolase family 127 protein [Paludibacter sp.]